MNVWGDECLGGERLTIGFIGVGRTLLLVLVSLLGAAQGETNCISYDSQVATKMKSLEVWTKCCCRTTRLGSDQNIFFLEIKIIMCFVMLQKKCRCFFGFFERKLTKRLVCDSPKFVIP